jgi:hypothetical protein
MNLDYVLLSISLFCDKEHWPRLVREGVKPFIGNLYPRHSAFYSIELNYELGENIRLPLLVGKERANELSTHINRSFKHHFNVADYSGRDEESRPEGIFMPFPPNTIQYGLYQPVWVEMPDEIINHRLRRELSDILLEALEGEEIIADEATLMLAIYLHFGLLRALRQQRCNSKKDIRDLFQPSFEEIDYGYQLNELEGKFEANSPLLIEIAANLIFLKKEQIEPSWAGKWVNTCDNALRIGVTGAEVRALINKHLGSNYKMQIWTEFFITRTLALL